MLDFNQALIQEVSRLSSILFPAEAEDIRLCGLSSVSQMWVKLWNSASVRGTNHLTLHQEWEENGIMDAVQIRSDIPQVSFIEARSLGPGHTVLYMKQS